LSDVLLIEGCNFKNFPVGGQLSFAKHMMQSFGNRLALVGICTDDTPVGQWVEKVFEGVAYQFFGIHRTTMSTKKPLLPARLKTYVKLRRFQEPIMSIGIRHAFVQNSHILMAVSNWEWSSLCYRFAGIENPLEMSRYSWAKAVASLYDKAWISSLGRVDILLASADEKAIDALVERSRGRLQRDRIVGFTTRINTRRFRPTSKTSTRKNLGIKDAYPVIVTCGRINWVKGWKLVLHAFITFLKTNQRAQLFFVGDGEDRGALQNCIDNYEMAPRVSITGFKSPDQIVQYLNVSDIFVVGSYREGWSIAMLEALACGCTIVSTNVSGAHTMIVDGENGFVINSRDPSILANAMDRALKLKDATQVSLAIADKYALKNLAMDLGNIWRPLA